MYDRITKEDIVIDYIDQCNTVFRKFGYENVHVPDYPECLQKYLGRKIWKDTLDSIAQDPMKWPNRPMACAIDIGVTSNHKTILIECNDAYALGSYGLVNLRYAKFISARWAQILEREDPFDFRKYGKES